MYDYKTKHHAFYFRTMNKYCSDHLQDESLAQKGNIPECNSLVVGAGHQQVCCGNTTGSILLDETHEEELKSVNRAHLELPLDSNSTQTKQHE